MRTIRVIIVVALTLVAVLLVSRDALAASKEECLEAHGRGQDLRDKGQLARSRLAFTACAQSSCPAVVQADCSRMSEEIAHLVPTVTFGARDANGTDLSATSVYVDDVLITTRLDDGKSYELDPGKHMIRYTHDGRETTNKVILGQGEKGRVLVATFTSMSGVSGASLPHPVMARGPELFEPVIESRRSSLPLVFAGVGAAVMAAGAIMAGIGLSRVPASCSVSSNECATSSNDPALGEAKSAVSFANTGVGVGIVGAAFLVGGVVWYLLQPTHDVDTRRGQLAVPYMAAF